MRKLAIVLTSTLAASTALAAESERTLTFSQPSAGVTAVVIRSGVGDVEILGQDAPAIDATVTVRGKHSSFWGSSRTRAVETARVDTEIEGATLVLTVVTDGGSHDRDLSEDWAVRVPRALAVRLKLGVGNVKVVDTRGDVAVEVGVGNVQVEGAWSDYGEISASCGVGDADLRGPEGHTEGEGFIGHSLRSRGTGKAEIELHAGVGDATVKLR